MIQLARLIIFTACLNLWAVLPAGAQIAISQDEVEAFAPRLSGAEIEFAPLEPVSESDAALINGVPADPNDFPAILRMTTGGTCTASLIGPSTVLLAAHCHRHGDFIRFRVAGHSVRGVCDQAPGYRGGDPSQDWSLCLLSRQVTGIPYETVQTGTPIGTGRDVLLTGYGCRHEDGPAGSVLLIGVSVTAPRPPQLRRESSTIYALSDIDSGGAILCSGDSGGPMFRLIDGTTDGRRVIEGVNSRTTYSFGYSLFSAMGSPSGVAFLTDWANHNDQAICGLNLFGSSQCKGG
jgi:hypothetical protein